MPSTIGCVEVAPKMVTLTDTLEQTEKQIYGLAELVDAINCKLNGPIPQQAGCNRPEYLGVYDQANHNQAMLSDLAVQLSRIAEKL